MYIYIIKGAAAAGGEPKEATRRLAAPRRRLKQAPSHGGHSTVKSLDTC